LKDSLSNKLDILKQIGKGAANGKHWADSKKDSESILDTYARTLGLVDCQQISTASSDCSQALIFCLAASGCSMVVVVCDVCLILQEGLLCFTYCVREWVVCGGAGMYLMFRECYCRDSCAHSEWLGSCAPLPLPRSVLKVCVCTLAQACLGVPIHVHMHTHTRKHVDILRHCNVLGQLRVLWHLLACASAVRQDMHTIACEVTGARLCRHTCPHMHTVTSPACPQHTTYTAQMQPHFHKLLIEAAGSFPQLDTQLLVSRSLSQSLLPQLHPCLP
jgi:hypothetical protein